jgi:uridine kinase
VSPPRLILIRGNSGSGKSTAAAGLDTVELILAGSGLLTP